MNHLYHCQHPACFSGYFFTPEFIAGLSQPVKTFLVETDSPVELPDRYVLVFRLCEAATVKVTVVAASLLVQVWQQGCSPGEPGCRIHLFHRFFTIPPDVQIAGIKQRITATRLQVTLPKHPDE